MLDSMPVEAVLLDRTGVIVAVNAHWDRFAAANGYPGSALGLGTNYLTVCLGSGTEAAVEGRVVAEGLHDVLSGRAAEFSTVYPCHSPTERRWFRLMAAPTADGTGAIVLHFNITPEMLAEERLVGDRIAIERRLARLETAMQKSVRTETGVLADAVKTGDRTDNLSLTRTILPRYQSMLHAAMGAQIYRRRQSLGADARAIAGDLAGFNADAAAVARLHAEALAALQAAATSEKAGWIALEARLAFIAVLGHLADCYRGRNAPDGSGRP